MAISQGAIDDLTRRGVERGVDLRPGMELVEQRLRTTVDADLPLLGEAAEHLMDAGGKRFRPMLVLLSGLLGGGRPTDDALVDAGVVVELVHLSTLYHDDVIDGADVRRGVTAAHVRWTNSVAILTGDFLLARASELSAELGVEVTRIMARTIAALCSGQIREVQGSGAGRSRGLPPRTPDREHYLKVIEEKTGSLISASCRLGALLAGLPREAVDALSDYGHHLGMSFQLADDVLDIASERTDSGKVPGTDLREGVRTMPVLYALEADGEDSELARLVDDPTDANVEAALSLLRAHPAMELARNDARLEAAKARRALRVLEPGGSAAPMAGAALDPDVVLRGLGELADYAANRVG
jgi:heptaprenyl diphosphate synthase